MTPSLDRAETLGSPSARLPARRGDRGQSTNLDSPGRAKGAVGAANNKPWRRSLKQRRLVVVGGGFFGWTLDGELFAGAGGEDFVGHRFGGEGAAEGEELGVGQRCDAEPFGRGFFGQDDEHSLLEGRHAFVGFGGDEGEAAPAGAVGIGVPEAGDEKARAVLDREEHFAPRTRRPGARLVKAGHGHETASGLRGSFPDGFGEQPIGAGIDEQLAHLRLVMRPHAPAHLAEAGRAPGLHDHQAGIFWEHLARELRPQVRDADIGHELLHVLNDLIGVAVVPAHTGHCRRSRGYNAWIATTAFLKRLYFFGSLLASPAGVRRWLSLSQSVRRWVQVWMEANLERAPMPKPWPPKA